MRDSRSTKKFQEDQKFCFFHVKVSRRVNQQNIFSFFTWLFSKDWERKLSKFFHWSMKLLFFFGIFTDLFVLYWTGSNFEVANHARSSTLDATIWFWCNINYSENFLQSIETFDFEFLFWDKDSSVSFHKQCCRSYCYMWDTEKCHCKHRGRYTEVRDDETWIRCGNT